MIWNVRLINMQKKPLFTALYRCCVVILMHRSLEEKKNTTKYIFKFFPAAWIITQDSINHCWCASLFPVAVNNQPQIVFVSSFWSVQESVGCGVLPPGKDPSLLFGSMFFSDRLFAQEDVSISSVAFLFFNRSRWRNKLWNNVYCKVTVHASSGVSRLYSNASRAAEHSAHRVWARVNVQNEWWLITRMF